MGRNQPNINNISIIEKIHTVCIYGPNLGHIEMTRRLQGSMKMKINTDRTYRNS